MYEAKLTVEVTLKMPRASDEGDAALLASQQVESCLRDGLGATAKTREKSARYIPACRAVQEFFNEATGGKNGDQ